MAVAVVQSQSAFTSGYVQSSTITPGSAVAAGAGLLLWIATSAGAANDFTGVTDTLGNTWVKLGSDRQNGRTGDWWWCGSSAAGTPTITATSSSYITRAMTLYVLSGHLTVSGTETPVYSTVGSTTPSISVTNTSPNALIVGALGTDGSATTYTAGSGYSNIVNAQGGDFMSAGMESKAVTSSASQTVGFTTSSNQSGIISAVVIKAATVGGPYFRQHTTDTYKAYTALTTPTTDAERLSNVYVGWKRRYIKGTGYVLRPSPEGNGDTANSYAVASDVVSEGQAYALRFAVQFNDQTGFDQVEAWTYNNMDRRNLTALNCLNNVPSNSYNTMAYHWNAVNAHGLGPNTAYDGASAYDADIDRAQALLWAHGRWGSAGTINYLSRALAILQDLVDYGLRQCAANGLWYMVSGTGNLVTSTPEMNNSYLDPVAFRMFAAYDIVNRSKWLSAVSSSYDIIQKTGAAVLSNPVAPGNAQSTTAGLPANWVTIDMTTGVVSALPTTYRDTDYTYDAFRQQMRLYYDWYVSRWPEALSALQLPKSLFTTKWNAGAGNIPVEMFHDGSNKNTPYYKRIFHYAAWFTLYANDASNTSASGIMTSIDPSAAMYVHDSGQLPYYNNDFSTADVNYYSLSWLIWSELLRQNVQVEFGYKPPRKHLNTLGVG